MSKKPLVSVIVPARNSESTLGICLQSIVKQSYKPIEIIVVDNPATTDDSPEIAKRYTENYFVNGSERCAQRNFGIRKAKGEFVMMIDSDMKLERDVVSACVKKAEEDLDIVGIVIPEESYGIGFWAKCKQLERSFYQGVPWMEAARFFDRETLLAIGGYDESLVSGEDWDTSQRISVLGTIDRVNKYIHHNEGKLQLGKTLSKKRYYAQEFKKYTAKSSSRNVKSQTGIMKRYALYFKHPSRLLANPVLSMGMLTMKTLEFLVGGLTYITTPASKD